MVGVILALFVFVITQSILKFVIEPVQDQKRLIGEVAHALSINATIQDIKATGVEETRKALRSLSGRLWASLWAIPFYDKIALLGLVPKAEDVMAAATELTVWSHTLTAPDSSMRHRDSIEQKLGIRITIRFRGREQP
jgi:hypothetical protein